MSSKRNRLSIRVPQVVEAVAEGQLAIVVLFVLAVLTLLTKCLGWW